MPLNSVCLDINGGCINVSAVFVCLQCSVSHACNITAPQGFASCQGPCLQSVTMPTTPVPVRAHHSPTFLKAAVPFVAESAALKMLPDNLSAPQLLPHSAAGQLHSESQRVQLQGLLGLSHIEKTLLPVNFHSVSTLSIFLHLCHRSRCQSLMARICHQ